MTAGPFIVFTALLLKDRDLRCAFVTGDAGHHSRSPDSRATDFRLAVAGQQQNVQLDRLADFFVARGHPDSCAFLNPKLFAAGFYNCVRHYVPASLGEITAPWKSRSL